MDARAEYLAGGRIRKTYVVRKNDSGTPDATDYVRTGEVNYWFFCPGCAAAHRYAVGSPHGWTWDGNVDAPTFTPSLLMNGREIAPNPTMPRCHLWLTAGRLHFLADCTHKLAGRIVELPPLPSWLR